jgi:hypothetical protein
MEEELTFMNLWRNNLQFPQSGIMAYGNCGNNDNGEDSSDVSMELRRTWYLILCDDKWGLTKCSISGSLRKMFCGLCRVLYKI